MNPDSDAPGASIKPKTALPSERQDILSIIITIVGTIIVVALYSSFGQELWIDEFLHFTLGSHHSSQEAWNSIVSTITTINHGQTGAHMMLSYWTMKIFGANLFLLRLPSLLAAAFMLLSYARIGLRLKFGPIWTLVLFVFFLLQTNLMYFAGETRPYMPLAAATAGVLAFYFVPAGERTWLDRCWGIIAILVGVTFHPYFSLYWLSIALFTFFLRKQELKGMLRAFMKHCDLAISIPCAIIYFVLAILTWLKGSPDFNMDPFIWIRPDGVYATFMSIAHFQFLGNYWQVTTNLLPVFLLLWLVPAIRSNESFRKIIPPLLLILCTLVISLLLAYASYLREYWVLPRQWVASMGLICFAMTWLLFGISTWFRSLWKPLYWVPVLFIAFLLFRGEGSRIFAERKKAFTENEPVTLEDLPKEVTPVDNAGWVRLANQNLREGGPVWVTFRRYYLANER